MSIRCFILKDFNGSYACSVGSPWCHLHRPPPPSMCTDLALPGSPGDRPPPPRPPQTGSAVARRVRADPRRTGPEMRLLPVAASLSLAVAVAYYVYTPLPDAIQEPWKLLLLDAGFRTTIHLVRGVFIYCYLLRWYWCCRWKWATWPVIMIWSAQIRAHGIVFHCISTLKVINTFLNHCKKKLSAFADMDFDPTLLNNIMWITSCESCE